VVFLSYCGDNMVGNEIHIPDHPLVTETIRDCLHEAMDIDSLRSVLDAIGAGEIRTVAIDTAEPSPLSHEILNANPYAYLDDAPLEERRARAVQMRRTRGSDAGEIGALDPAAIEEVFSESWPVVRDPDELHDALLTLIVLPPVLEWKAFFDDLAKMNRVRVKAKTRVRFPLWLLPPYLSIPVLVFFPHKISNLD
jgi:ATP-dependent helicase Lhr and Lhr-like helicase